MQMLRVGRLDIRSEATMVVSGDSQPFTACVPAPAQPLSRAPDFGDWD